MGTREGWGPDYDTQYEIHSRKNRARRLTRREQDRARRSKKAAAGQGPTPDEQALADLARQRSRSRQALIELRWSQGFVFRGGLVGGRPEYRRAPFVFRGLVSDLHPIFRRFCQATPRAARLMTGDHKAEASGTDSKLLALDSAYVESEKRMRSVLRAELDTLWPSWAALEAAITAAGLPLPNLAVGHVDEAGRVWRPHLLWLLDEAVCFTAKGLRRHQAAWTAALRGLTARLLHIGADPGGASNAHRHKNPLSPLWTSCIMAAEPYTLDVDRREGARGLIALRPYLPTPKQSLDAIRTAQAERLAAKKQIEADHPELEAQSNALFNHLNAFARSKVFAHRDEGHGSRAEFEAEIVLEALAISPSGDRHEAAARRRAASISDWTWTHYRARQERAPALPPEERRAALSAGALRAAEAKSSGTIARIADAIQRLTVEGVRPSKPAVARAVGKSLDTIKRQWPGALALLEGGGCISLGTDKKGPATRRGEEGPQAPPSGDQAPATPKQGLVSPESTGSRSGCRPSGWQAAAQTPGGPPGIRCDTLPTATPLAPPGESYVVMPADYVPW